MSIQKVSAATVLALGLTVPIAGAATPTARAGLQPGGQIVYTAASGQTTR